MHAGRVFSTSQEPQVQKSQNSSDVSKTLQQGASKTPAAKPVPLPLTPEQLRQVSGGAGPNAGW
jgi:hypothetical protein